MFRLKRTQADFDRKLGPVFAQTEQLEAGAHRPHARLGKEVRAVAWMLVTNALRNEHFHSLSEQFLSPVSKELLGLGVDDDDVAVAVDDDDGVRRRFEDA